MGEDKSIPENSSEKDDNIQEKNLITFVEFLESTPPSSSVSIIDLSIEDGQLPKPEIRLHCGNESCNGTRYYRCTNPGGIFVPEDDWKFVYLNYVCSNCRRNQKTFSLAIKSDEAEYSGTAYKFGEIPAYGPPTPSRLITLIGPDREIFLKGRRCENQGLGIGAFVYYRRVVENQKNRILDQIIKVSQKLDVSKEVIDLLEQAKIETQFDKAVTLVKDSIPQALLIDGHNPLTLLYRALSKGLHEQDDEHCLELANSVRVILAELSERMSQVLKDEVELKHALSKLLNSKSD